MTARPVLRVCALYPRVLNVYGDRGNLIVLRDRCEWRGIGFALTTADLGQPLDGQAHDLYYLGGGQDRDQRLCAEELAHDKRDALAAAADRGALVVGVCGGYQLLGHGYQTEAERLPGLGLLDLETVHEPGDRLVGNTVIETDLAAGPADGGEAGRRRLAGFENHAGRTYLGEVRPLGRVLRGHGNNGRDGSEGAVGGHHGTVIGTYLHGPLLCSNAWLADWLIASALGVAPTSLETLDDAIEDASHATACHAAGLP